MSTATETIEGMVKQEYKYGFYTDVEVDAAQNIHAVRGGLDALGKSRHTDSRRLGGMALQFFIMALGEVHLISWMAGAGIRFNAI